MSKNKVFNHGQHITLQ